MASVRTAIILAAGLCARIKSVLPIKPKGFVEVGGQPIIERSIQLLHAAGIERIIIVTGYESGYYDDLARRYAYVMTVKNEDYAHSGSMYSLYHVRSLVDEPFLLLDSDLIYESRALRALMAFQRPNAILLSGMTLSGDEYYVETSGERYRRTSQRKDDLAAVTGEFVGISRIDQALFAAMLADAAMYFRSSLYLNYEGCIDRIATSTEVFFLKIDDLVWAEIDDAAQLQRARTQVLPQLLQREQAHMARDSLAEVGTPAAETQWPQPLS